MACLPTPPHPHLPIGLGTCECVHPPGPLIRPPGESDTDRQLWSQPPAHGLCTGTFLSAPLVFPSLLGVSGVFSTWHSAWSGLVRWPTHWGMRNPRLGGGTATTPSCPLWPQFLAPSSKAPPLSEPPPPPASSPGVVSLLLRTACLPCLLLAGFQPTLPGLGAFSVLPKLKKESPHYHMYQDLHF